MTTELKDSIGDVANHLGAPWDSACRWIDCHGLPMHKVAHLRKFKLSEIDNYVRQAGADAADSAEVKK